MVDMTKPIPVEKHKKRGPRPRGNVQASFQLPPEMLEKLKKAARENGLTKSAWLIRLLETHLEKAKGKPVQ
jgi:hypothetical protein